VAACTQNPSDQSHPHEAALTALTQSAAANIPGVDFASITVLRNDRTLHTLAATEPLAREVDALQYELLEGPCYAAVTDQRFVLVNNLADDDTCRRYGPKAVERGVGAQAAIQLSHNGEQAGLNLYARNPHTFDQSTVEFAELFATHATVLLGYARQVETLGEAAHARQDIGTATGIMMERHGLDRDRAFAFLVRTSNHRNTKVRVLAQEIIDGTFQAAKAEERDIAAVARGQGPR
jgi:ANTAR domain/GAF domain